VAIYSTGACASPSRADPESPDLFLKYHLPACQRRCERLHAAGKSVVSHWDGDVKPLLRYAKETGLDGIEAVTPSPQGDVTIPEIHEALGDRVFLQDGIPAVYFDHTFPFRPFEIKTFRFM